MNTWTGNNYEEYHVITSDFLGFSILWMCTFPFARTNSNPAPLKFLLGQILSSSPSIASTLIIYRL